MVTGIHPAPVFSLEAPQQQPAPPGSKTCWLIKLTLVNVVSPVNDCKITKFTIFDINCQFMYYWNVTHMSRCVKVDF